MNEELNNLITKMRMKDHKYKRYIFIDKESQCIWSFETAIQMNKFIDFYCQVGDKFNIYNNGRFIVLRG